MLFEWVRKFRENHRRRRNRILAFFLLSLAGVGLWFAVGTILKEPPAPYTVPSQWQSGTFDSPSFGGRVFTIQAGMGHDESVILVHGLGRNASRDWFKVIPALEKRYHVIAFDLPGFGRSESPDADYTPTAYARLLHEIRTAYAKKRTAVVGHSMGAAVALRYAADYPGELSQLVLVDAAGILERTAYVKEIAEIPLERIDLPAYLQGAATSFENVATAIIEWLNLAPDPLDLVKGISRYWKQSGLDASQFTIALELLDENYSSAIYGIHLPCAVLWGGRDRIAPLRTAKVLAGHIDGAVLHIFPEAGHVPMATDTQAFNATLLALLEGGRPAPEPRPKPTATKGTLYCKDEVGTRYSGHYDTVVIDRCKGVELVDITAKKVSVTASSVAFENLELNATGTAFEARRSVIVMTNAEISGKNALRSESSRIDMAGGSLRATQHAVEVETKSRLIFSICDVDAPGYTGFVHGDYRLKRSALFDAILAPGQSH